MNLDIGKLHHGRGNEAIFWFTVTKNKNKNVLPLRKIIMLWVETFLVYFS